MKKDTPQTDPQVDPIIPDMTPAPSVDLQNSHNENSSEENISSEVQLPQMLTEEAATLEGTILHYQGEDYDLSQYTGQQYWQNNMNELRYALTLNGAPAIYLPVEGVGEANELEAVCNKYFRGW